MVMPSYEQRGGDAENGACAITIAARRIGALDRMDATFEYRVAQIYMDMQQHIREGTNDPVFKRRSRASSMDEPSRGVCKGSFTRAKSRWRAVDTQVLTRSARFRPS